MLFSPDSGNNPREYIRKRDVIAVWRISAVPILRPSQHVVSQTGSDTSAR
jgi:hypothetical protein